MNQAAFGILGRLLVRIPYIVFGDFSSGFLISIVLWWSYNSLLFYVAYQMEGNGQKKELKKIIMYGGLATLIKAAIDTCIDLTNMLILVAAMEISMILYIIGLDYFLFVKVGKRKVQRAEKNMEIHRWYKKLVWIKQFGILLQYLADVQQQSEQSYMLGVL